MVACVVRFADYARGQLADDLAERVLISGALNMIQFAGAYRISQSVPFLRNDTKLFFCGCLYM